MRRHLVLAKSGFIAGTAALLILSSGVASSAAATSTVSNRPADILPCDSLGALPVVGTVCGMVDSIVVSTLPATGGLPLATANSAAAVPSAGSGATSPVSGLIPNTGSLANVQVPVQICGISVGAISSAATGACPATGPTATGSDASLANVVVPVQVCGVSVGAISGTATGACPATGPAIISGGSPSSGTAVIQPGAGSAVDVLAPIQVCGVSVGAIDANATGACPATGPSAASGGTGGGLATVAAAAQVCGIGVGAISAKATGACPATGPSVTGGGGLINIPLNVQVCGVSVGALGSTAVGSCPTAATTPPTTVPTTPTTVPGAPDTTTATTAVDTTTIPGATDTTTPGAGTKPANIAPFEGGTSTTTPAGAGNGGGGSNLPVTGISITVLMLAGAAMLHWGVLARLLAGRKLRRPTV